MRFRIGLVSNLHSRGLLKDAMLLRGLLVEREHDVAFVQYDNELTVEYDLLVFLETIVPQFVPLSKHAPLFFVNPEFLFERDFPLIKSSFGKVLCKTYEAHRICKEVFGEQAVYTGFLAEDKLRPGIEKEARFLHIAGKSNMKNTQAVVDAWRWKFEGKPLDADLTVIASAEIELGELPDRVTLLSNISEEALTELQNRCMFHLQPSATEGFGHVLREALSVNAQLITTRKPPMNEIASALYMDAVAESQCRMATVYEVSPFEIHRCVKSIQSGWRMPGPADNPRLEFTLGNEDFKDRFSKVLDKVTTKPAAPVVVTPAVKQPGSLRIAFLGNFSSPESTENMVKWALERLGHRVIPLQENKVSLSDINRCPSDLFLWVRTPGWLDVRDASMELFLEDLKERNIPSISLHLDKFFSIPEREALIGKQPFWKTEFVFTADGGFPGEFQARGVNHHWMRPSMSEVYLHPGILREEYRCDVGFVGAREYHAEYPFRPKLVDFLQETYGSRFKHITNLRGHGLNDFYASCAVTVGDHIFAGETPYYYSDRAPESAGRGAFLLYPETEGLYIPCATYKPQNLQDLEAQISFWLGRPKDRQRVIDECVAWVRTNETWTTRMACILATVAKNGQ